MTKGKASFEEQLKELEEIVQKLEGGEVPLEESLALFQHGMALSKELSETLGKAEKTLTKIISEDGGSTDFEVAESND